MRKIKRYRPTYWHGSSSVLNPQVLTEDADGAVVLHSDYLAALAEICPDDELPAGPTCPRCGAPRLTSGVDGGSWVHANRDGLHARFSILDVDRLADFKAKKLLDEGAARIRRALAEVLADERLSYPTATVDINAPLALVQLSLETRRDIYREALRAFGLEP